MRQEPIICADMILLLSRHFLHVENIRFENDFNIGACEQNNTRKW